LIDVFHFGLKYKNMNNSSDNIQDKLAQLKQSYRNQLPDKMEEIKSASIPPAKGNLADIRRYLETLEGLSHKLAGSGATFGFPEISVSARSLENACENFLNQDGLSKLDADKEISPFIDSLQMAVLEAVGENEGAPSESAGQESSDSNERLLLIISDNEPEVTRITQEMENSNFSIRQLDYDVDFESSLKELKPAAIIVEISPGREDESGLPKIEQLREREIFDGPLIVMAKSGDIHMRLQAARASADSFMEMPASTSNLVDILEQHLSPDGDEDFRILIVDDDISTAKYTEVILQGAGMIAEIVTDPMLVMDKLDDFGPELILMDLYMPGCSGQELAVVVRQQETYSTLPIVFLSGESDIDKQLIAMRSGGDDFLTKPIKPQHLISSVRTRVRRFRMLRSRMVRDSMTGLLNHTTTHEFLENEVARATRNKTSLSVAAIDIDRFKSVNDTHGHAVGDQVIKSLSRLLKQRLRSNDVIGRMGGEEFAAVLAGTSIEKAAEIFNGVRLAFSEIDHPSGDEKFSVTISCGIAEYPAFKTSADLLEAADTALYEAKNSGRNRVVLETGQ
jgi:diguanylate cyclase (GGDEF)-like protein